MDNLNEYIIRAEHGDIDAGVVIAAEYIESDDFVIPEGALQRIKNYLSAAVEMGNTKAMSLVGDMYRWGKGVDPDLEKARFWYNKAEEKGDTKVHDKLRETLTDRDEYMRKYEAYRRQAEQDDPVGLMNLGDVYLDNLYVDRDPHKAYDCYARAYEIASADDMQEYYPQICMRVGNCYAKGTGTECNMTKAAEFFGAAVKAYRIQVFYDDSNKKGLAEADSALNEALKVISSRCYGGR